MQRRTIDVNIAINSALSIAVNSTAVVPSILQLIVPLTNITINSTLNITNILIVP